MYISIYIYMYMYVCVYKHSVYGYVYIYIYVNTHMYIYADVVYVSGLFCSLTPSLLLLMYVLKPGSLLDCWRSFRRAGFLLKLLRDPEFTLKNKVCS